MPVLIDHQNISVPVGSQNFGPANVPDSSNVITFRLARCTTATPSFWPSAGVTVQAQMYVSLDGGNTWVDSAGFGSSGGIHVNRLGIEVPESTVRCPLPPGTGRRVKATVTVAGETLVSQLTVEVEAS